LYHLGTGSTKESYSEIEKLEDFKGIEYLTAEINTLKDSISELFKSLTIDLRKKY
jgi:hypothetical protein